MSSPPPPSPAPSPATHCLFYFFRFFFFFFLLFFFHAKLRSQTSKFKLRTSLKSGFKVQTWNLEHLWNSMVPILFSCFSPSSNTLPVLCPALHLQCRQRRGVKPLHFSTQVSPHGDFFFFFQRFFSQAARKLRLLSSRSSKRSIRRLRTSNSFDAELDDEISKKRYLHHCSNLELEEPSNWRQAYHSYGKFVASSKRKNHSYLFSAEPALHLQCLTTPRVQTVAQSRRKRSVARHFLMERKSKKSCNTWATTTLRAGRSQRSKQLWTA